MNQIRRKKICFVVAVPGTANAFLKDHIDNLSQKYDIYLAGNIHDIKDIKNLAIKDWYGFPIERNIDIKKDLKAVRALISYFKRMKFDAVHSVTPKAGLITALAAKSSGIKHRIHIFTGQVWATRKGVFRWILKTLDKVTAKLDNHILVDGKSQRDFIVKEGVVRAEKSKVLGDGSICGVNTDKFCPDSQIREDCRKKLGITDDKVVFVFMGRLNRDKGVYELLSAFNKLAVERSNAFLLIFGIDEENIASQFSTYDNINNSNFLYYGRTSEPYNMLQAGDIFVLPTYREGFGSSVIEAACLGIPTITSDAYGVLDASVPGKTGLQCRVADVDSLYCAMLELVDNPTKRTEYGKAGRQRVLDLFSSKVIVKHWEDFYDEILG